MAAMSPLQNKYDLLRQNAQQDQTQQRQTAQEALQRRFSRLGGLNSGAYIKAGENTEGQLAQANQSAMRNIDVQQATEEGQLAEAQKQREFQTAERVGGQQFAAGERTAGQAFANEQAGIGRTFATSERTAGQAFANEQAGIGRTFATSERTAAQKFAADQAAPELALKSRQVAQIDTQIGMDKEAQAANLALQKALAEHSYGIDLDKYLNPNAYQAKQDAAQTAESSNPYVKSGGIYVAKNPSTTSNWWQNYSGAGGPNRVG